VLLLDERATAQCAVFQKVALQIVPLAQIHMSLYVLEMKIDCYRVFKAQADWTFILPSELPAKELLHLPRKIPQRGTTY
jgi:hypothetical protein